jgi:predicted Fe-Mo cluster-binding NifX family protein
MKVAIPVKMNNDNPAIAPLFGKAKWFAMVDGTQVNIIPNNQSGGNAVIEWLNEMQIDVLLVQEMGQSPYEKIKEVERIALFHTGFERILLSDVLEKFKNSELEQLDDTNMDKIIKHHEKRHPHH